MHRIGREVIYFHRIIHRTCTNLSSRRKLSLLSSSHNFPSMTRATWLFPMRIQRLRILFFSSDNVLLLRLCLFNVFVQIIFDLVYLKIRVIVFLLHYFLFEECLSVLDLSQSQVAIQDLIQQFSKALPQFILPDTLLKDSIAQLNILSYRRIIIEVRLLNEGWIKLKL